MYKYYNLIVELLVNPTSYLNALEIISNNADGITIGTKETSTRNNCILSIEQIKEIVKNKKNTKIFILVNKIFFEPQINELTTYLLEITKLNIDGIIFADYAIPQILFENTISNIELIYNPETLVVNYGQFAFFKENGINGAFLSNELSKENVELMIKNKNSFKLAMQVAGYSYIVQSRWNLLTNFKNANNIDFDPKNKIYYLKEQTRNEKIIIFEDENNTNIFTGYNLCLYEHLNDFKDIDYIYINSFLHNEEWTMKTFNIFNVAIKHIKKNEPYDLSKVSELKTIDKKISAGFYLMKKEDLIYLSESIKLNWNEE